MKNHYISYSAPASLMLFGEHAALYGYPAIAIAVSPRLETRLHYRADQSIKVISNIGEYSTTTDDIKPSKDFSYIVEILKQYNKSFNHGFELEIISEIPPDMGLGSSAATTLTVLSCICDMLNETYNHIDLLQKAVKIIRSVQGRGSGTDLATSLYGGIIYYQPSSLYVEKLPCDIDISVIFTGYKTPTAEVIERIHNLSNIDNSTIWYKMGHSTELAKQALITSDNNQLQREIITQQQLLKKIGVSDDVIDEIVDIISIDPNILAAKISGAGLGDCVIGFGKLTKQTTKELTLKLPDTKLLNISHDKLGLLNSFKQREELSKSYNQAK
ncbi:MAG: mevalonate kinase [Rickettsiaceae bacterium]|nr:mevalonate kinase [Rickettsiaceae bacterium]